MELDKLYESHTVTFHWVKGHVGVASMNAATNWPRPKRRNIAERSAYGTDEVKDLLSRAGHVAHGRVAVHGFL